MNLFKIFTCIFTICATVGQPALAEQCTPVGGWTGSYGGNIIINSDLSGTNVTPNCSTPGQLQVTLTANGFVAVGTNQNSTCKPSTYTLTFSADCSKASGTVQLSGGNALPDTWISTTPRLHLSRTDLSTVVATGTPDGGTFSYAQTVVSGSVIAQLQMASGTTATSNPNTTTLADPPNPSGSGAPNPGGLGQYNAQYSVNGVAATNDQANPFQAPVFGMSCYYTELESDWGTQPNQCQSVRIRGTTYTGTISNPYGYPGTYCASFIAEVKLQGSGVKNDGTKIQYDPATNLITAVGVINGSDGTPVVAGMTVARSRAVIPGRGVHLDVHNVGQNLLANDTGNAIVGYRLDFYQGAGSAVCSGYNNPMAVSACNPAQATTCPGSALQ